jgi:Holliday junction DNA helicase RuvA
MIDFIEGQLIKFLPTRMVVLTSGGVAYTILTPASAFPPKVGPNIRVFTHLSIREDAHTLYGFPSVDYREFFELLMTVQGVGPKKALNMLSGATPGEMELLIGSGNSAALAKLPGVGGKTASLLILELKGKTKLPITSIEQRAPTSRVADDAVSALMALGQKKSDAKVAVEHAMKVVGDSDVGLLVKTALRKP